MRYLFFTLLICFTFSGYAQDDLFGTPEKTIRKGVVIGINGNFDVPAADMAKRFGLSYRIGGALSYKTKTNWLIGVKTDFIFGNRIKEDSLMSNISNDGIFIGQNGIRTGVQTFERGYLIGVQLGKNFDLFNSKHDNGLLVMTGVGFIQHKILIENKDNKIVQLRNDYRKGYDRLSNGFYIEQYAGYNHFSGTNSVINFHIGVDILAAFTKGRRDFLYDVRRPDTDSRFDLLFGIRGGWYIPIFKKKSEEIFFE